MQCGPLREGSRALSSPALTLSLQSVKHAGLGPRGLQGSLLPAHSFSVYLCFFAEGHAKTSFSLCPLPPYLVHCFMCAVGLLGLLPPPLHICVLSSRSSVPPTGRAEFWAGSTSARCPPHPCLLSPGPGAEAEMRGQHPPEFTVRCPQRHSWLSKVRPYASQTLWHAALAPLACCWLWLPAVLRGCACLFQGLFGTQSRQRAGSSGELLLSGPICSATSFRPRSLLVPNICPLANRREDVLRSSCWGWGRLEEGVCWGDGGGEGEINK